MGQPAPIPRRSRHLGSAACSGRSDHGSHASTSAASSRSNRRQGNHNQFQTLKMFPDGHLGADVVTSLEYGLTKSHHVILILSEAAIASRRVALELSTSLYRDPNA